MVLHKDCAANLSTYREREKGDPTMSLTINTNISSIITQRNLNNATNSLNTSIERMTTGYKINHAKDNAAGYSIADRWVTQISTLDVAADNAATGVDLLTTAEQNYGLLTDHLQRIRDLTEQAANGTYGSSSLKAIQSEVYARLQEIDRIASNAEFNGIKLMSYIKDGEPKGTGMTSDGLNLQVGLYSEANSVINLDVSLFSSAKISALFSGGTTTVNKKVDDKTQYPQTDEVALSQLLTDAGGDIAKLNTQDGLKAFAAACSGLIYNSTNDTYSLLSDNKNSYGASAMLGFIDNAMDEISRRVTAIGAAQNRVESVISAIDVQSQNLTSSLSTLIDTDVAEESSNYIQAQILQQASATLLATANQTPSIALNLI